MNCNCIMNKAADNIRKGLQNAVYVIKKAVFQIVPVVCNLRYDQKQKE